jgi:hypothetical protein
MTVARLLSLQTLRAPTSAPACSRSSRRRDPRAAMPWPRRLREQYQAQSSWPYHGQLPTSSSCVDIRALERTSAISPTRSVAGGLDIGRQKCLKALRRAQDLGDHIEFVLSGAVLGCRELPWRSQAAQYRICVIGRPCWSRTVAGHPPRSIGYGRSDFGPTSPGLEGGSSGHIVRSEVTVLSRHRANVAFAGSFPLTPTMGAPW